MANRKIVGRSALAVLELGLGVSFPLGDDGSPGDNELHGVTHAHVEHSDFFFREHEEESTSWIRGGGDKDVVKLPATRFGRDFTIGGAGKEADGVAVGLWVLDHDDPLEDCPVLGCEGFDDLLNGLVDCVDDGDVADNPVCQVNKKMPNEVAGEKPKNGDDDENGDGGDEVKDEAVGEIVPDIFLIGLAGNRVEKVVLLEDVLVEQLTWGSTDFFEYEMDNGDGDSERQQDEKPCQEIVP